MYIQLSMHCYCIAIAHLSLNYLSLWLFEVCHVSFVVVMN